MDRELLEVGLAVEVVDPTESHGRIARHQHDECVRELRLGAGAGQGPDAERLEQRVGRRLETGQQGQLVGPDGADDGDGADGADGCGLVARHGATVDLYGQAPNGSMLE
jgi:hypothetical protein